MHKQQQAAAEVDKKLLDMELKICKTFNDTMEQHVEVVKAIKEEMVAVRQLQEKQGNILVALESSVQELKEPVEDETGGEDQPALDPMTINLDPSLGGTIPQSTATPILPPWSSMKWGTGSATPGTNMGTLGSS